MEKLICYVCGLELTGLEGRCPRCRFPVFSTQTDSEEEKRKIEELAEEYRRTFWANAEIFLRVYSNRLTDEGEVEVASSELISLGKASDFQPGQVHWHSEKFARLFGDCTLDIVVEDNEGVRKERSVTIENPRVQDFWSVGLLADEHMSFRIVIGTEKQYSRSEPISIQNK